MEKKYTEGDWRVRFFSDDIDSDFFIEAPCEGRSYGIEIMGDDYGHHNKYPREQRLADAKLIAASPDLLEALQLVLKSHEGNGELTGIEVMKQVKAAIKKATT